MKPHPPSRRKLRFSTCSIAGTNNWPTALYKFNYSGFGSKHSHCSFSSTLPLISNIISGSTCSHEVCKDLIKFPQTQKHIALATAQPLFKACQVKKNKAQAPTDLGGRGLSVIGAQVHLLEHLNLKVTAMSVSV